MNRNIPAGDYQRCERCGNEFYGDHGSDYCSSCSVREDENYLDYKLEADAEEQYYDNPENFCEGSQCCDLGGRGGCKFDCKCECHPRNQK